MSDEKVKPTVLGKVEIPVYSDGNVSVTGPVNNPVVMMDIFGRAMIAVVKHITGQVEEGQVEEGQVEEGQVVKFVEGVL